MFREKLIDVGSGLITRALSNTTSSGAPPPVPPRPAGWDTTPVPYVDSTPTPYYPPPPATSHSTYQQPASPRQPQPQPQHSYQNSQNYYQGGAPAGFPAPPQQPAPAPSRWTEHLFYSNGRETPEFEALMREFFKRLDPQGTGYITPEAFSGFLDVCQYRVEQNVWKRSLKGNVMFKAEDMADFEMKAALEGFYFDHKVVTRDPRAHQLPYGGMPLLSLAGFTDFMGVELAADPDVHIPGLNAALRHYGVWPERGPVPRYVFPASRPAELQRRIEEATVRCRASGVEKLNAHKAQKMLEQRGQQNALDLLSDYRYVYY